MTAIEMLAEYVRTRSCEYRKQDDAVTRDRHGATHVWMMDKTPEGADVVDAHFVNVGRSERNSTEREFSQMIRNALGEGVFCEIDLDELMKGPSYIRIGAWLGSQDLALCFMGLGQLHGLWEVITPERLGLTGDMAEEAAGGGLVLLAPLSGLEDKLSR